MCTAPPGGLHFAALSSTLTTIRSSSPGRPCTVDRLQVGGERHGRARGSGPGRSRPRRRRPARPSSAALPGGLLPGQFDQLGGERGQLARPARRGRRAAWPGPPAAAGAPARAGARPRAAARCWSGCWSAACAARGRRPRPGRAARGGRCRSRPASCSPIGPAGRSRRPRRPAIGRVRSMVTATSSTASVSRSTGTRPARATARPSRAAPPMPTTQPAASSRPKQDQRVYAGGCLVDRHLDGAAAGGRHGEHQVAGRRRR